MQVNRAKLFQLREEGKREGEGEKGKVKERQKSWEGGERLILVCAWWNFLGDVCSVVWLNQIMLRKIIVLPSIRGAFCQWPP